MKRPDPTELVWPDLMLSIADDVYEWLPPWLVWLLFIPWAVAVLIGGIIEYLLRVVITPSRYW